MRSSTDADLVTGDDESRRQAQAAHRRRQRVEQVRRAQWPEVAVEDLEFGRFFIEHRPTGELFKVMRGEVYFAGHDPVDAYFVDGVGDIVFLQQPTNGPRTVDELEERRSRPKPEPRRRLRSA